MARLLVVDDDEDQIEIYTAWLEGHEVTSCISPIQAVCIAESHEFDLIISDFSMPEMNGVNFISKLAQVIPAAKLKVYMLTGISDDLTLSVIESMPQITLGSKPVPREEFESTVERLLSK